MKPLLIMLIIAFTFSASTQAAIFSGNPFEINEISILEDGLYSGGLPK